MTCPQCNSRNILIQNVTKSKLTEKRRGALWWLLVGWWWAAVKWIVFTVPALILRLFRPKRYTIRQRFVTVCICQNCGKRWDLT